MTHAGEELLDLVDDGVAVTDPPQMILAIQFHHASTRDVRGKVAPTLDADALLATAVKMLVLPPPGLVARAVPARVADRRVARPNVIPV